MAKTAVQLDREIAATLARKNRRHHAAIATATPHLEAIRAAIYQTKDPDDLIAAVSAAEKHVAVMKRLARKPPNHPGSSGGIDSSGTFDPTMYDLGNELVRAKEMVRRIKIQRKTGRFPKPSRRTAWKLRP